MTNDFDELTAVEHVRSHYRATPPHGLMSPRRLGWSALVGATLCWGAVVVLIKVAAAHLAVAVVTAVEVTTATVVLGGALLISTRRRPRCVPWLAVLAGIVEPGLAYPLINSGLDRTSGTHGAVILGAQAAVIVAIGAVTARQWPRVRVSVAVLTCVAGASVVSASATGTASLRGDLVLAAGTVASAAYVPLAQRLSTRLSALELTFWQFGGGAVVVLGWLAASPPSWAAVSPPGPGVGVALAAAVAAGIAGSAVAFVLYNFGISRVSTAEAGLSVTLIPVFGVVASMLVLGENPTAITAVGTLMVILGLAVIAAPGA